MTNISYGFWSADINTFSLRTELRYIKYILTSENFSSSIWSRSLAWSIYPEGGPPIQTLDNAGGQLGQPLEYLHSQAQPPSHVGDGRGVEVGQAI